MTTISTPVAMKQDTYIGPDVWAAPVVGAIVYPLLVNGFVLSVEAYKANGVVASKVVLAAAALVLMGSVLAVPFVALRALIGIRNSTEPNAPLVRRVLHLVFATPPVLTVSGFAASALDVSATWAWYGGWGLLAMITFLVRKGSSSISSVTRRDSARLRKIHGTSALFLLMGFLALHLGNHLTALWTVQTQNDVMIFLRGWYRSAWVQPIIIGLFVTMIVTGILLVIRYTATTADKFRTLQTASGGYFAAFIASHTLAVFTARANDVDTNWDFAAGGPLGLLHQPWRGALIDYYALSVFLIAVHAALGLRIVLLAHHTKENTANRVVYAGAVVGALVTALIMAAALGLHLGS
jgi:succinate dehydrogenase hydrophobic anchor subunit